MAKIQSLFAPTALSFSPSGGTTTAGQVVTLDTNIEDTIVVYSLDGSLPVEGNFGTHTTPAPVEITIKSTTRIRARAFKRTQTDNTTKTQEQTYTVTRTGTPLESFRTTQRFFGKLVNSLVDLNFYNKEGWVVPTTTTSKMTYLFVNREPFPVLVNFIHNDVRFVNSNFPAVDPGASYEFTIEPISGDNTIEIQTSRIF